MSTFEYLWVVYIFPQSVCLFGCSTIGGPILGIHKSLTEVRVWKLGTRPRSLISGNIIQIFFAVWSDASLRMLWCSVNIYRLARFSPCSNKFLFNFCKEQKVSAESDGQLASCVLIVVIQSIVFHFYQISRRRLSTYLKRFFLGKVSLNFLYNISRKSFKDWRSKYTIYTDKKEN